MNHFGEVNKKRGRLLERCFLSWDMKDEKQFAKMRTGERIYQAYIYQERVHKVRQLGNSASEE